MTIFLLMITTLLLFYRLKNIPRELSKRIYLKKVQEAIDKVKINLSEYKNEKDLKLGKTIIISCSFFVECILMIYYIILGSKIGIAYFSILTVIQLLTVIYSCYELYKMRLLSEKIEDYPFHRWNLLFNIVLDLIYYPLAIYLLLK